MPIKVSAGSAVGASGTLTLSEITFPTNGYKYVVINGRAYSGSGHTGIYLYVTVDGQKYTHASGSNSTKTYAYDIQNIDSFSISGKASFGSSTSTATGNGGLTINSMILYNELPDGVTLNN